MTSIVNGYREDRLTKLKSTYRGCLEASTVASPHLYTWLSSKSIDDIVERGIKAVSTEGIRSVIIQSDGWKRTAKALGIKCTYIAFEHWLQGS